jgi:dGTPase
VLAKLMPDGFHHVKQSLRVVEVLEREGKGLNLSAEVRDGILKHSKGKGHIISENPNLLAMTLEGQIVRIADIVAYVNHDLDDSIRAKVLSADEVPPEILAKLGRTHSQRISRMVGDMVASSRLEEKRQIRMSEDVLGSLIALRDFLYEKVYERPMIRQEFERAQRIIGELWEYFHKHPDEFRERHWPKGLPESEAVSRAIGDFITGMTDRYAMRMYEEYFLPRPWMVF